MTKPVYTNVFIDLYDVPNHDSNGKLTKPVQKFIADEYVRYVGDLTSSGKKPSRDMCENDFMARLAPLGELTPVAREQILRNYRRNESLEAAGFS